MILLLVALMALVSACGGDDGSGTTEGTDETSTSVEAEPDDEDSSEEMELPDNCTLVTAEEATALAGYELEMSEDSPAGCAFLPPGSDVADMVVNTVFADGDATTVASNGFPNAAEIIPVSVGDDTVAVTTPAGDAVASIVTASDGKILELAIVFLLIDPSDTARVEEAAQLAVTALGRWGG
jgi:hypothetical protein